MDSTGISFLLDYVNVYTALIFMVACLCCFWHTGTKTPPGPMRWPVFGTFPQIAKVGGDKIHEYFEQLQEEYGSVAQIYFGNYPLVVISGFDAVNEVFVNQSDHISGRPESLPGIEITHHHKTGIFYANGDTWVAMRKAMESAASLVENKPQYEEMVLEEMQQMIKDFADKGETAFQPSALLRLVSTSWHNIGMLDKRRGDPAFKRVFAPIWDIRSNDTVFSPGGTMPLVRHISSICKSFNTHVSGYCALDKALMTELEERRPSYNGTRLESVLDVYMKEQEQNPEMYSDDNVAACVGDYLVAGASAFVHTLDWALLYLKAFPDMQKKCQEEIRQVCGKDPVTFSHIDKLPYVTANLNEAQRIGSAVPNTIPYLSLGDMNVKGHYIPRGTMVMGNIRSVLLDVTQWKDPKTFNPDRFLDENGKLAKKTPAFVPFGFGTRYCPGGALVTRTMVVVLASILQSFEFISTGKVTFDGRNSAGNLGPEFNEVFVKKRI